MTGKIVITRYNEAILVFLLDASGRTVEIFCDRPDKQSIVGNIYAGRVTNIASGMNAAFVEYERGHTGYLRLGRKTNPHYINILRDDGPLREGDIILVQVKRDAAGKKGPSLTCRLDLSDENRFVLNAGKDSRGLLYENPEPYVSYIDTYLRSDPDIAVVTDVSEVFLNVRDHIRRYYPNREEQLSIYKDRSVSFDVVYSIHSRIRNATEKKVNLRSGACIVIEPTEALVSIDVNTGRSSDRGDPENEYLSVNLEAACEVARQIRLRNLSGIIIIDFINMRSDENRSQLLNALKGYLEDDPLKPVLIDMTPLGLVEITRKKVYRPLYEVL